MGRPRTPNKSTYAKIMLILEYLLEMKGGVIYVEMIEKDLNMPHASIQRFLNVYFSDFIEYTPLGRMRLIRLKDPTLTFDKIMRYYDVRKQLRMMK